MNITVWTREGKQFILELDDDATVEDLFIKFDSKLKTLHSVGHKGKEIRERNSKSTLFSIGISDGAQIFASRRFVFGGASFYYFVKTLPSIKEFSEKLEEYKPK